MRLIKFWIFIFYALCYGQEDNQDNLIVVEYNHILHIEGMPSTTAINATLVATQTHAVYEMDFMNNSNFIDEEDNEKGPVLSIRSKSNPVIFKDVKRKVFFNKERILSKEYLVEDEESIFNWVIKDNYKDILGYRCQEAITHYRGRDYKAYFTTKIQFNTGPWKFGGLPGLILGVESIDGVFKMHAHKLEIKNQKSDLQNPFKNDLQKAISWDDFIKKYRKKFQELLHYRAPDGGTMSIPTRNIEVYID